MDDLTDTLAGMLNHQDISRRQTQDDENAILVRAYVTIEEPRRYNWNQLVLPFTHDELRRRLGAGMDSPHFYYEGTGDYVIHRLSKTEYFLTERVPETMMIRGDGPFSSTFFLDLASKWRVEESSRKRVVKATINHPSNGQSDLELSISPVRLIK